MVFWREAGFDGTKKTTSPGLGLSPGRGTGQSVGSVGRSVGRWVGWLVGRSVGRSAGRSVGRLGGHIPSILGCLVSGLRFNWLHPQHHRLRSD